MGGGMQGEGNALYFSLHVLDVLEAWGVTGCGMSSGTGSNKHVCGESYLYFA